MALRVRSVSQHQAGKGDNSNKHGGELVVLIIPDISIRCGSEGA